MFAQGRGGAMAEVNGLPISFACDIDSQKAMNDIDKTMDVGRLFAPSMREYSLEARTI